MSESDDPLRIYVESGSHEAFARIVHRHVDAVYSQCRRQLGNAALVEEATQTVFFDLSQKASRLPRDVVLSGWLFKATRFVCAKIKRSESRRRKREQRAAMMRPEAIETTPEGAWQQAEPMLDDAIAELGERDRDALLLRFFEGMTMRQVALATGVSEDAAKQRVSRAVEKLRVHFGGRGLAVPSATVVAWLGAAVKPAGATVAHAAIQFTVAKGAVAATHKLAWLSHLWTWPKIAMGSAAACAVTATVIASGVVTRQDKTSAPPQYAAAQIPDALQSRDLNSNAGNTPAENSSVDADLAWITAYSKKTFDAIVSAKYLVDISGKQSEEPFTLEVTGTVSQRPHDGFELLRLAGQYHYTDVFLKAHQDRSTKSNVVEFVGPQSAGVYHPGNPYAQEFSYPRVSEMSAEAHMAVAGTGAPHPEFYMFGDGLTKEFLWDNVLKTKDQTSMYRWRVESEKRPTGSPRWHLFVYIFARNEWPEVPTQEFILDPEYGYCIVGMIEHMPERPYRLNRNVTVKYLYIGDSKLPFPSEITEEVYGQGDSKELTITTVTRLRNIELNTALLDSEFTLSSLGLPDGAQFIRYEPDGTRTKLINTKDGLIDARTNLPVLAVGSASSGGSNNLNKLAVKWSLSSRVAVGLVIAAGLAVVVVAAWRFLHQRSPRRRAPQKSK